MDAAYTSLPGPARELEHRYGPNVHILGHPYLMTLLAQLCSDGTIQPRANRLISTLYSHLFGIVAGAEFRRRKLAVPSRMIHATPKGVFEGELLDAEQKVVTCAIARAGILPSQVCYEMLNDLMDPRLVRQDHIFMNRVTDAAGKVTGVSLTGSKIGGPVDDAILLVPDPMGATASTMIGLADHYMKHPDGAPARMIAMHLIVTPEYLKRVGNAYPHLPIWAIRLDRGLSPAEVLAQPLGAEWARERGLNEKGYIVPGGGGFGEVLNNALL
jgi:uracil phosphoribosyltransferase